MTNPKHQLTATLNTLQHLNTLYPNWHRWITTNLQDGYPSSADYNVKSRGTHTDPTLTTVLQRQQLHQLLTEATQTIQQLHNLTNRLHNLTQQGPPQTQHTGQRCKGTIDPTCTKLADGRHHKTGLCDTCWQRHYRTTRNTETQATTSNNTNKPATIR